MTAKIYFAEVNEMQSQLDQAWALLPPDEKAKAKRFRFEADQKQCILAHGLKRKIIGEELDKSPETLEFEKGESGRPYLSNQLLHFNLSHSQGAILLGISHDVPIGVDVEKIRDITSVAELAERYFHESECQALERSEDSKELFYRLWVAKEAILKANGCGIAHYLDKVVLDVLQKLGPSIKPRDDRFLDLSISSLPDKFSSLETWHLEVFSPANNVFAAVASPAQIGPIEFFHSNFNEHLAFRPVNG